MLATYIIAKAIGFVAIFALLVIVAILIGSKASWVIYGLGIAMQTLSIIGNSRGGSVSAILIVPSLIVAVLGALLINLRINKKTAARIKKIQDNINSEAEENNK